MKTKTASFEGCFDKLTGYDSMKGFFGLDVFLSGWICWSSFGLDLLVFFGFGSFGFLSDSDLLVFFGFGFLT